MVGVNGIKPQVKKVEALVKATPPTDLATLRTFLGAIGYMRRFIPNFSELALPLTRLTAKGVAWRWNQEEIQGYEQLLQALCEATLLHGPSGKGKFVVMTDASNLGIGGALFQEQGDMLVPIEFASRKLTPAEVKWNTTEKELFAVKWALEHWSHFLLGRHFVVLTDHANLQYLQSQDVGKVARWALYLQAFDFKLIYIKGENNQVADWLSRALPLDVDDDELIEKMVVPVYLAEEQRRVVEGWSQPITGEELREACKVAPGDETRLLSEHGGLLCHAASGRLYVPPSLRERVVASEHLGMRGGHQGVSKTYKRVSRVFWWPQMKPYVAEYMKGCLVCNRRRASCNLSPIAHVPGQLGAGSFGDIVNVDHIGPVTVAGTKYLRGDSDTTRGSCLGQDTKFRNQ
jgi:hypothetical protein